ncbi:hypothetical protein NMG60_11006715 [Bertholletia excelsa]
MANPMEDFVAKGKTVGIEPKNFGEKPKEEKENGIETEIADDETGQDELNRGGIAAVETKIMAVHEDKQMFNEQINNKDVLEDEAKKEEAPLETEPRSGISFPVVLGGKRLNAVGLRKKSVLGLEIKVYAFGIYAENEKLKELLLLRTGEQPTKPTKEMYQLVIDSDVGMLVRLVIVFSGLTMSMVRKNFDESLGASIQKLSGGKNNDLAKKIMSGASDDIKLTSGSVIETSRLPGYILQMKVKGEIVSKIESELLCRAYINMYLGNDPFDKEAKERFGASFLSLF